MGEFFSARNYHQEAKDRRKKEKEREKGKEFEKKGMEKKGEGGFVFNFYFGVEEIDEDYVDNKNRFICFDNKNRFVQYNNYMMSIYTI